MAGGSITLKAIEHRQMKSGPSGLLFSLKFQQIRGEGIANDKKVNKRQQKNGEIHCNIPEKWYTRFNYCFSRELSVFARLCE